MRVGIIGSGNIASQMAATINQVDGVELYAVAHRDGGLLFMRHIAFFRGIVSVKPPRAWTGMRQ